MRILKLFRDWLINSFFPRKLARLFYKPYSFVWIVHSRNIQDFYRHLPLARVLPKKIVEVICRILWPFIVSDITGLKDKNGKHKIGCILGIPLLPQQILNNKVLAEKRILQGLKLAEKIGAQNVGLGGYNSSITKGGETVYKKTSLYLTNGYALLSGLAITAIKKILRSQRKNFNNLRFGIIGATTIPGKILAEFLIRKGVEKIILVGKTQEHLEELKQKCLQFNRSAIIKITTDIRNINDCDFIIIATNTSSIVIPPEYIKNNSIIFDITQPPNPFTNKLRLKKDIKVISGLAVNIPKINCHFDLGLSLEQVYPCLAEVILLVKEDKKENFGIGDVSLIQVNEIISLAKKYNFNPVIFNTLSTWE